MWKSIKDYDTLYEVDDCGRVRSLQKWNGHKYVKRDVPYILKQSYTTTGYKKVELVKNGRKKSIKVHRIVAEAFIENTYNKPNVNHKDGNRINNNVDNLEWVTQKENVEHACRTGLRKLRDIPEDVLKEYVESGLTMHEIESKEHISWKRLKGFFDKYNLRNNRNIYCINLDNLKKDFKEGKTNKELAEKYNCPSNLIAVRRYQFKKRGVDLSI